MAFIETIQYADASETLAGHYRRLGAPGAPLDNILLAHSLRPASLAGHMALYKAVLHHRDLALPRWFLETVGVLVSRINRCDYCVAHHRAGLARLLGDGERAARIDEALAIGRFDATFTRKEAALLDYARALTRTPASVTATDIGALREAGADDGEILEVNQVAAYFAYANRTVLGLGVETAGEALGRAPSGPDPQDWTHHE